MLGRSMNDSLQPMSFTPIAACILIDQSVAMQRKTSVEFDGEHFYVRTNCGTVYGLTIGQSTVRCERDVQRRLS
jgi:hypothetical protein